MADLPYVNLVHERHDPEAIGLLTARDAWNNLVLPMRVDAGVLICATTDETFEDARRLVADAVPMPARFVLADLRLLEQFIAEKYHFEGIDVEDTASVHATR
jgi:hypothetical protein